MKPRYRALRTISKIYKYAGFATFVLGIIIILFVSCIGSLRFDIGAFIGYLIFISLSSIGLIAVSELIQLMISIEENTRATAQLLARLTRNQPGNVQ